MNRSEALEFFDAAYRRGMQWVDAMEFQRAGMFERFRSDMRAGRKPSVSGVELLVSESFVEDARNMHRETMAMIAWEVCGPAFAEAV